MRNPFPWQGVGNRASLGSLPAEFREGSGSQDTSNWLFGDAVFARQLFLAFLRCLLDIQGFMVWTEPIPQ